MRTTFSPAAAFKTGQYVTADGTTAIALGWAPGPVGKQIVVKMTGGGQRGKLRVVPARRVKARRGRAGSGPLARVRG